ncbi:flavin reductase family protein [Sphingobium sp. JS3065]|uniref:flavin reductase family protein n=1 Tax=Sphingobium sp. JS3065 TaxID=2970925 RepID=UPI002263BC23|nr:flavin reductase family protein [Sphingobium sp. JS3065]UZW56402.1 flavin reductase family protein [Sphingobium sp. JS3065]
MIDEQFKQAMRRLASTIAILTGGEGDGWTGIVATAVTSVTADPPTLLAAVNRTTSLSPVLHENDRFCVNLLAKRHRDLVSVFSGAIKGRQRFDTGEWQPSPSGLPVLCDAAASLECQITSRIDVGTHTLFIGEVVEIVNHPMIDPLIWMDGRFASAALGD